MMRLPDRTLPDAAQRKLVEYQAAVDALPDYEARVARAKTSFHSHNHRRNDTFNSVKEALTAMCSGVRRCAYCEDSLADEVEHIWPKAIYPERAFLWSNYLYACGPCNGPKNNHFAVFAAGSGALTEVARPWNAAIVPPIAGDPVLLDPRSEDPCEYLALDLRDTFWFTPRARRGTREFDRAKYTIKILRLNENDALPKTRQQAYKDFRAHLSRYLHLQSRKAEAHKLEEIARDVRQRQQPTVWAEMKRQRGTIPELAEMFEAVPEALGW
jgi:uncharacterized protein (TIGR02646 family)